MWQGVVCAHISYFRSQFHQYTSLEHRVYELSLLNINFNHNLYWHLGLIATTKKFNSRKPMQFK